MGGVAPSDGRVTVVGPRPHPGAATKAAGAMLGCLGEARRTRWRARQATPAFSWRCMPRCCGRNGSPSSQPPRITDLAVTPGTFVIRGEFGSDVGIAANHAAMRNCTRKPEEFAVLSERLSVACERAGRCLSDVERSVLLERRSRFRAWRDYVDAGADHVVFSVACQFDPDAVAVVVGEIRGRCG